MRAAFIPALPPSALMGGMIAPSFRLVNRFSRKKLLRTCGPKGPPALCALFSRSPLAYVLLRTFGRRERPPALCAIFSWSPLACGRVPYPPYARCGMGRLCGERRRRERFERPSGARNAACSTRHRPPPGLPPAPAVRGLEGRSPPSEIVSPGSAGRAGSLRPQAQTFLTRFPGRAEGAGETCAPRRKRSPTASFSDARRQAGLFRRPIAVCRSSPRCPR